MLIVIVIIGILAAALIPRLTGIQGRARDTARKADLQQIGTSLATYKLDTNSYPMSTSWNTGDTNGIGGNTATAILSGVVPYMTSFPKESNSAFMKYAYISNGSAFALASVSEGGKANANWSGGATATSASLPANFSGGVTSASTASSLASQLCTNGGTTDTCVGTAASGSPRYIYIN